MCHRKSCGVKGLLASRRLGNFIRKAVSKLLLSFNDSDKIAVRDGTSKHGAYGLLVRWPRI